MELQFLDIGDVEYIIYLFDVLSSSSILRSVETIVLANLNRLHDLFGREKDGVPQLTTIPDSATFYNLKSFIISRCGKIKKLFLSNLIANLQNLERIDVRDCSEMEEIIAAPDEESSNSVIHSDFNQTLQLSLPKLKTLELELLPKLKSICTAQIKCESLQKIRVSKSEKLELIPISLPLPSLKILEVISESWWESVHWGLPYQKDSLQPIYLDDDSKSD